MPTSINTCMTTTDVNALFKSKYHVCSRKANVLHFLPSVLKLKKFVLLMKTSDFQGFFLAGRAKSPYMGTQPV